MIEITSSFDKGKWDEFVLEHPNGNIFQTSLMAEVFRQTKNYEPISLAAINDSGEIMAVLQAAMINEMNGILKPLTVRSVLQGGPIYTYSSEGKQAVAQLIKHYDSIASKKVIYTQIRNIWDTEDVSSILTSCNYTYEEHLDFLIDLDRKEEEIWSDIHKSRRKGINRASRDGLIVKNIETPEELAASYELVSATYKRFGVPIADITLFQAAYKEFYNKGMSDFLLALQEGKPVGTRITLKYKGMVYDWYAGSVEGIDYVDEILVWHILKENAGKYKVFDFGGAGHPAKPYGVREFKRRFGGQEVNFGRYEKVHSIFKKHIASKGIFLLPVIKKMKI